MKPHSTRHWSELPKDIGSFDYAAHFVDFSLMSTSGAVTENLDQLSAPLDRPYFRPALELLVAGLVSGAGPLGKHTSAANFAVSIVDHLVMGWSALLRSHLRVSCTLSRHVAEAAIFEAASMANPEKFEKLWEAGKATGGQVLKQVRSAMPPELADKLAQAWKLAVSFGHVNQGTVWLAKLPGGIVGAPKHHAVTFDGPHNGPLEPAALLHVGMIYVAVAETALHSFAYSFKERLPPAWSEIYLEHASRIAARSLQTHA